MDLNDFSKLVFDPIKGGAFLVGLGVAGPIGFIACAAWNHKEIKSLRSMIKTEQKRSNERDEQAKADKREFAEKIRNYEYDKTDYESQIEALKARIRTIRCHCGANMRRIREYPNRDFPGAVRVELKCSDETCGQDFEYDKDELKLMTKQLNGV